LESRIEKGRSELLAMRTRKLDASGKGKGDFFVLASPAKNDQVKFVSGDSEIRALADVVKSTNLDIKFPNASSVRVLRRGTVTCGTLPPPPVAKGKASSKKGSQGKATASSKVEPAAKPELLPGPCSVELLFSDAVRSVD
jgi:hypothetical protein